MSLRTVPAHPRVSIIVPTFNEAPNLERVLPTLPDVHEVIVVDGGSADGTVETAQRVMPSARVMQQTRTGKGNAPVAASGIRWSKRSLKAKPRRAFNRWRPMARSGSCRKSKRRSCRARQPAWMSLIACSVAVWCQAAWC